MPTKGHIGCNCPWTRPQEIELSGTGRLGTPDDSAQPFALVSMSEKEKSSPVSVLITVVRKEVTQTFWLEDKEIEATGDTGGRLSAIDPSLAKELKFWHRCNTRNPFQSEDASY